MSELIADKGEDLDEKGQEHGKRFRGRYGSGITPPDSPLPCRRGSESARGVTRVSEDGTPPKDERIVFHQAGLVTLREQDIPAAMGHGEERILQAFQRGQEGRPGSAFPQQRLADFRQKPLHDGQVRLGRRIVAGREKDHVILGRFA